jgi:hypothetical protein
MFSGSTSRQVRATAAALALVAIGGCAAPEGVRYGEVSAVPAAYAPVSPPLSIGDIVAGLQAGHAQAQLADGIRERGLFAPATSADLDLLRQHGAGAEVLEAVQDESASLAAPPPVVVSPAPVTVVPGYGWYPWVPFSFGYWWYDGPARHPRPSWRPRPPPPPGARPPAPPSVPGRLLPGGKRQIKPDVPRSGGTDLPVKPSR